MNLTVIGFLIAVVGIILQLADAFPEHRETRKTIVILSIGVFVGIAASALLGAKYEISGNFDRSFTLLFALAGGGVVFGLIAVFARTTNQRDVSSAMAAVCAGMFLLVGMAVAAGSSERNYSYTSDEVMVLANRAEEQGQYEIAMERFDELRKRIKSEEGLKRIEERIKRIELLQAGVAK